MLETLIYLYGMNDIDVLVTWVDGNDPQWQAERNKYAKIGSNPGYYRDWGLMKYWFRGIEKNLPWVRHVVFVTYGHLPKWLNVNHPKLRIVNHKDHIPSEFLPTFSPMTLGAFSHKIETLSEQYIVCDDDVFFVGKYNPEDFFSEDGLPKDYIWLQPITEQFNQDYVHLRLNTLMILKRHFHIKDIDRELLFSEEYPKEVIEDNIRYSALKYFPGFKDMHTYQARLKSTTQEIWDKEWMAMYEMCRHRFRTILDPAHLYREWGLASGKFSPCFPSGICYSDTADENLKEKILNPDTKVICINESEKQNYTEERAKEIQSYLEERLPEKSAFELF